MLQGVYDTVYVLICLLLLVVVLLQQGKGGDIAAAFGGGSSQTAFGARSGATVLTRATTVLGTLFMLGALGLAIVGQRGNSGSVVGGVAPTPVQAPAAPAPTTTTPAAPAQPKAAEPGQKPAATPEKAPEKKPGGGH
jgi:preprotein translocase subunit SecG